MAKPRNSVLYLFDPLQQSPSRSPSPCRNSSSPELGASDKENDVPAGDITMFFNRTFGLHKDVDTQAQQPRTPKGKLIDIGDTPAQDRHWDDADDGDAEHDGSDADGEQSESDVEGGVAAAAVTAAPAPRTPLADLAVEETPRPHQSLGRPSTLDSQQRPLRAPVFTPPTSLPRNDASLQALFPAPQGSPLAEVINSINLSAMGISDEGAATTPTAEHAPAHSLETTEPDSTEATEMGMGMEASDGRPSSPFPEINICAPETPVLAEFDLERPEQAGDLVQILQSTESPATSGSTLRPPSTLTQLSPDDPRRASVDLYSSFHLQMQSAEMSFDLLNDKISFLGGAGGQDSFWAGGEDADAMFEFDEERRENAAEAVVERHDDVLTERAFTPPRTEISQVVRMPVVRSPTDEAAKVPLPMSPPPSTPSPRITSPRAAQQVFETEPPSPPTSPVTLDEPSLLLESEPLPPPMPAPVPALRIMKKTFKLASRQTTPSESASKPSVSPPTEPVAKVSSVSAKATPNPVSIAAPQPTRPAIRGVQRPPASMLAAGNVIIGLPPQGNPRSASTSTSSSSSSGSSASRPARAQTQDAAAAASRFASAGVRRPTLVNKERPATIRGTAAAPVPRPTKPASGLTRTASTSAVGSKTSSASSGIRPPSRIAAPGSNAGAGSALPRPASKLPGPSASGLARHASVGGLARPRVVTAPRAPTGGRF